MTSELDDDKKVEPGANRPIDSLLFPNLQKLYTKRIGRLQAYDSEKEERAWQNFLVGLIEQQRTFLSALPTFPFEHSVERPREGRDAHEWLFETVDSACWLNLLEKLSHNCASHLPPSVSASLKELLPSPSRARSFMERVAGYHYKPDELGVALLARLAYSTCLAFWAESNKTHLSRTYQPPFDLFCPVCRSLPVGGAIAGASREGLLYLQCSLCEVRWHKVRDICLVCGQSDKIELWEDPADEPHKIQTESCQSCHFYIKLIRHDRDPSLDLVVDDMCSAKMDRFMNQHGYHKLGVNPFSLPIVGKEHDTRTNRK